MSLRNKFARYIRPQKTCTPGNEYCFLIYHNIYLNKLLDLCILLDMNKVRIEKIKIVNEKTYNAIRNLLAQLYPESPPLEFEKFQRVVNSPNVSMYIVSVGGEIVGTS